MTNGDLHILDAGAGLQRIKAKMQVTYRALIIC
jgi:hypothetical protein